MRDLTRQNTRAMILRTAAVVAVLSAAIWLGACQQEKGVYDTSQVVVRGYRYVVYPHDENVHVVAEIENAGEQMVEEAILVVEGIGRSGEHRGEQRVRVQRLAPGERRCIATTFTNRARLATVEVHVEPVPEEER